MGLIKRQGENSDNRSLTYHGSAPRREILKRGGQAERIRIAIEQEGSGAVRTRGHDAPGPGKGRARR